MAIALALGLLVLTGIPERDANGLPHLRSESVLVRYADTGETLLSKRPNDVRPIASVTKLLTSYLIEKDQLAFPEWITIEEADKDRLKWSKSHLKIGHTYRSEDLYRTALIASDNRAIYALVRSAGIERAAFVEKMNAVAKELGMTKSAFRDPAGIDPGNVSTANDLLKLIEAVAALERVKAASQQGTIDLVNDKGRTMRLTSTNRLARSSRWSVVIGKTGYTVEAGRALVLRVQLDERPIDMVFLGAREMMSVFGDAGRVRRWLDAKNGRGATASLGTPASPNP
jgi:serine-type D-Ala-D-Ala endopeptidase (penicillin-binding protein 7)